jgi:hypothetical protein
VRLTLNCHSSSPTLTPINTSRLSQISLLSITHKPTSQTTTTSFRAAISSMNASITSALHSKSSSSSYPRPSLESYPTPPSLASSSSPPMSPTSHSVGRPVFFSFTNRFYKKTFLLSDITGEPKDQGYLTMVWEAGDRPTEYRPVSWVHLHPLKVRIQVHPSSITANGFTGGRRRRQWGPRG